MNVKTKIQRFLLLLTGFGVCLFTTAQESGSVFNFLNLPVSSHSTALGSNDLTVVEA